MAQPYSVELCRQLQEKINALNLHRPMRIQHYDIGDRLTLNMESVTDNQTAGVTVVIDKFVGGGFAGQVYRIQVESIEGSDIEDLQIGGTYAIKILIPPSGFSKLFRNLIYWIGFQGPFQLQVNPAAAKAGALWQKFIRRAAKIRFGDERAVRDIHALFVDPQLGSCGQISEWIEGRTWRLEVDDHMDYLKKWQRSKQVDPEKLGSPEYRSKKVFMADFVKLLHDMGAYEFARQYEWSTCKSQPNCLKRTEFADPTKGLTAVDFRAGLALLACAPMSPGDFILIYRGLKRGSLVQFDRGSIEKLKQFIDQHPQTFTDMTGMFEELKRCDRIYRDSLPDITHHLFRLFYSGQLWSTIFSSAVTGYKVRQLVDENGETKLRKSKFKTFIFFLIGLIPLLGRVIRKSWCHGQWRKHYGAIFSNFGYLKRALKARSDEQIIRWHRAGRINHTKADKMSDSTLLFLSHWSLSLLPAGLHRFLTDYRFAKEKFFYLTVRPVKLYFNAQLREQWLRDMVADGQRKHMLSDDDARTILSQIDEPFIQKYLKSLAVHVCTLPVTQIVSVAVAIIFYMMHPEMPKSERMLAVGAILAAFQVVPLSPGSLVRGLYVLYLVIRERNFKDYNIAVFLGFFKYVGYLAFPIQMTYRYPALARFMAGHWATEAVHIVPVFGERGALLEHWVFSLFYNWPLTIRRRMKNIARIRQSQKARYWHIPLIIAAAAAVLGLSDFHWIKTASVLPSLRQIWYLTIIVPVLCGITITLDAGGMKIWKRIVSSAIAAICVALFYTLVTYTFSEYYAIEQFNLLSNGIWRIFIFTLISVISTIITELKRPDPELKKG